ncbi:hypothetical protein Tco_0830701 [Tanacetum coccineum]
MDEEEEANAEELYKDLNLNLRTEDAEMTDADRGGSEQPNVSQKSGFEQIEEDAYVTLTVVHDKQKTDVTATPEVTSVTTVPPPPSSFNLLQQQATPTPTSTTPEATTSFPALLDFSLVFKFNNRVTNLEKTFEEVKTQLPQILPEAVSDFATPVIEKTITESLEAAVLAKYSSQPKSTYEATTSLLEFELTKILIDKMEESKSYQVADYKKEIYDALKNKDHDPSARSDRGTKRRKTRKEGESSKDSRSKEKKSSSTSKDTSHSQHKSSGKSAHAEEPSHKVDDSGVQQNQEFDTGHTNEQPDDEAAPNIDWFKKTSIRVFSINERLDWHNPEGKQYPFDLRKPLPLIQDNRGLQVIPKDYFINNDLEYLKRGSLRKKYSTSVTKSKAATYEGIPHWDPKRQRFHGYATNRTSTKDVYSRRRIIAVTRLKIMKWYDYDYLDEIEVRRDDQQLYTFKEGDFSRLRLQDIEDMLLLLVQQKLTNITIDERYDFNVGLPPDVLSFKGGWTIFN